MLGTAGAVASGVLPLPGAPVIAELAAPVTETHAGTATVELGNPPDGATHVALQLTCLTAGMLWFPDGASVSCRDSDAGTTSGVSTTNVELAPGQRGTTITTAADVRWRLTATYVSQATTEWGVNADGNTFGVENHKGAPDLIAAIATNEQQGYVKRHDLDAANGTTAAQHFTSPEDALRWQEANTGKSVSIPVYEADGSTVIGEFTIGH